MKVAILYDTKFGNGKNLAETLAQQFPSDSEIKIGDVKETNPAEISTFNPDVLVLGGAIRMFFSSGVSKKWIKEFNSEMKKKNHQSSVGAAFLTHGLPTNKVQGYGKRFLKKVSQASQISKTYPECLLARVSGQEGPFADGEVEKGQKYIQKLLEWM